MTRVTVEEEGQRTLAVLDNEVGRLTVRTQVSIALDALEENERIRLETGGVIASPSVRRMFRKVGSTGELIAIGIAPFGSTDLQPAWRIKVFFLDLDGTLSTEYMDDASWSLTVDALNALEF